MADWFRITNESIRIDLKVTPGASKTCITGAAEDRLCVRIAAAPEDGKANEELRAFLAKALGMPKKDIVLESGEKSRLKTLKLPAAARGKAENLINARL